MARKRGPKNKIETLSEKLIKEINEKLLNPSTDLGAVLNFINSHPENNTHISASSLNRYAAVFDKEMKELQDIKNLVNNLPKEFNFDDESKFHSALAGMLSKVIFEFVVTGNLKSEDLARLSRSLKDIMSSTKDREKIKADLKKEIEIELKQEQSKKLSNARASGKISKKGFDEAIRILGL